jgi:hypothetical protein
LKDLKQLDRSAGAPRNDDDDDEQWLLDKATDRAIALRNIGRCAVEIGDTPLSTSREAGAHSRTPCTRQAIWSSQSCI